MTRVLLLFLVCLVGVAANFVLILKFQSYRAPALIFVVLVVIGVLIFRFIPAAPAEKRRLANKSQREVAKPVRRLAYLYIFGLIVFVVSGQYKALSGWQGLLCALPGLIIIVYCLWSARRIEQIPADEWKKRIE
jgi:uncharacterized membrane protein